MPANSSQPNSNKGTAVASSVNSLGNLLSRMWKDYVDLNPAAGRIHALLTSRKEDVLNDHIALRTYNHPRLGISQLAKVFEDFGYSAKGEYHFKEKKLYAKHWEHEDLSLPKIFISELLLEQMSPATQKTVAALVDQVTDSQLNDPFFSVSGRPWKLSHATYLSLAEESEYASWLAAVGFRPNHFTVNVNALKSFSNLVELNDFLTAQGVRLNSSGGLIKGTPGECLEQSSTMAEKVSIDFTDGSFQIPGCYYEFARRYPLANGKLYQGFIAASADKIFESTNRR